MGLASRALFSLFSLYREAVACRDHEAMAAIQSAVEAMESSMGSSEGSRQPAEALQPPGELRPADGHAESVESRIPVARRLHHPEGSGIVIAGVFVAADKVTVLKPSRRKAASSIQRSGTKTNRKSSNYQKAARWVADNR